jgi:hypothetical protein
MQTKKPPKKPVGPTLKPFEVLENVISFEMVG